MSALGFFSYIMCFCCILGGGPLVNVFLRPYFDVFRQNSRFNFCPSKQTSFYVFGLFVDSRRGTLVNVFLRAYFDIFRQKSRFHFFPPKPSLLSMCAVFIDSIGGDS